MSRNDVMRQKVKARNEDLKVFIEKFLDKRSFTEEERGTACKAFVTGWGACYDSIRRGQIEKIKNRSDIE